MPYIFTVFCNCQCANICYSNVKYDIVVAKYQPGNA